jgi:succinate dehydrogenase/fumarate reductase flavoprotein subunit
MNANQEGKAMYEETTGRGAESWPYSVNYGKENEYSVDILVLGGGVAGCHAAITAARRGARVAVVEKGATLHSGSGGAGVDHWGHAYGNPCSKVDVEEAVASGIHGRGYLNGMVTYITARESWDALLDVERMGLRFRDEDDEFAGAPFRDDETKIMFAYDYVARTNIRVRRGYTIKPVLHREMLRRGIQVFDRVMATALLTEDGKPGSRVVGATGVNVRTGEFYIFRSKATLLTTAQYSGIWVFNTELAGSAAHLDDPNNVGEGTAMAWKAGAALTLMERSKGPVHGSFGWPRFGIGAPTNTWFPCTIVDANGKEVPWVDREDNVLSSVAERTGFRVQAKTTPDLEDMIAGGEIVLPLYADLPGMPEYERRAIWGLMISSEGKTRIPIYEVYGRAGFDPNKDMLLAPITSHEVGGEGLGPPLWRSASVIGSFGSGGVVVDWDLKTTLPGLYAAGTQIAGYNGGHPGAASTGRYAARKASAYARTVLDTEPNRRQIEAEKQRVYQRIGRRGDVGWKELNAGICKAMQVYCGAYKSERMLRTGLWWLDSIRQSEAANGYVRNPHELGRYLECLTRLTVSEIIIHASLARRASSTILDFHRVDYPTVDPMEWRKHITLKRQADAIVTGELDLDYYLAAPYASTFEENYEAHSALSS